MTPFRVAGGGQDKDTVQRCKSERSSCAKVQKWMREYRVWSIEYRERQNSKGAAWGKRIIGSGIYFRVSGDGHRHREFRCRPFGHRELAPGFRRLMAERLTPERPTTVADTRHLE